MADDASLIERPAPPAPRRFTRAEFDAATAAGVFREGERVELIGGEIVSMASEGDDHVDAVDLLAATLQAIAPATLQVLVRTRLDLPDDTEVYPDILVQARGVLVRERGPANVRLLVEVADSSLKQDRDVKAARYAAAGFAEYWVYDVAARRLWVHRRPDAGGWREVTAVEGAASPLFAPDARVALP